MTDPIRESVQHHLLDAAGDGWSITQYVVAMGLERINPDGTVEATAWYWAPEEQPAWQTSGLLGQAKDMHEGLDQDDFD